MENVAIYDKLENVLDKVEYNGGGIDALLNGRIVKSVQRGIFKLNISTTATKSQTININNINTEKSILITNIQTETNTGYFNKYNKSIQLTSNSIVFSIAGSTSPTLSWVQDVVFWQVIEFY